MGHFIWKLIVYLVSIWTHATNKVRILQRFRRWIILFRRNWFFLATNLFLWHFWISLAYIMINSQVLNIMNFHFNSSNQVVFVLLNGLFLKRYDFILLDWTLENLEVIHTNLFLDGAHSFSLVEVFILFLLSIVIISFNVSQSINFRIKFSLRDNFLILFS